MVAGYRFCTRSLQQAVPHTFSADSESLWNEKVLHLGAGFEESAANGGHALPLFILGNVFYPQGTTVLNVFEMKYR
jgi:hypothetical protein